MQADIKNASVSLNIGSLAYNPQVIMMYQYDGDRIFNELEQKLIEEQGLSEIDMLNLIFLPLMKNSFIQTRDFGFRKKEGRKSRKTVKNER